VAFAIFFPAATGIEAGANMSGDLKDPARSIPTGTILAVIFTAIIYALQLVLMAGFTDSASLVSDPFGSLQRMSVFGPLIIAGVFAGTLSSALGSFLGAPRILQAMGKDRLLRPLVFFAKGHGEADEPRRATVLSLFIALAVVWAGNLNAVAEVISMFFLIAYGMMNVSAFVEARSGNPSFRPRFRWFGWPTALAGAIGCGIAMVKIDATYAFVSIAVSAGIYLALRGRAAEWGDAKRGYIFARTRDNLLTLEKTTGDSKNWRPMLAVVTTDAERDRRTVDLAATLEARRGLLSVLEIRESDAEPAARIAERRARTEELRQSLTSRDVLAFADSFAVADAAEGASVVMQSYSIGGLRPNTIMAALPPPTQPERRAFLAQVMACASAADLNVVLYKGAGAIGTKRIDVWWHGMHNGSLMAMFAYLITSHPEWRDCRVRLMRVVTDAGEHLEAERNLAEMMNAARLAMDVDIVLSQRPIAELIIERSKSADVVMLGLAPRDLDDFEAFCAARDELLLGLPTVLLIRSNGEVDLLA
jgi:solute carrier family 12 (sodium/potassium/chloride transporter), member 2